MNGILIASSILLWVMLLLNLLLTLALIRRVNTLSQIQAPETLKSGQPAPAFRAENLQGKPVTLADFAGRMVAFIFVAPTCEPCRREMPLLETLYSKAKAAGVELVLVSDATSADARKMADEFLLTLPVLAAPRVTNEFMATYKVGGTPFYCWIDAEGKVITAGFLDQNWRKISAQWENKAAPSAGQRPAISLAPSEGR